MDLKTLGFSKQELAAAFRSAGSGGLTDEDEVPELAEQPVSRTGDIWQLGTHRLACGDCTDRATVEALLCEWPLYPAVKLGAADGTK